MNNKFKLMLLLSLSCLLQSMEDSSENEYNPFSDGNPRIGQFVGIKNSCSTWSDWFGYTQYEESWTTPKGRVIKRSDLGIGKDDPKLVALLVGNFDRMEDCWEYQRNLDLKSFKTVNDLRAHFCKQKKGSLEKESEK